MKKQTVINTLKKNGYERFEDNHYVKGGTSVNLEENSVMGFGGLQEVFQSLDALLNYLGLKEHTEKKNNLDWAMCIDCKWQGSTNECEQDGEYSEWHGRSFEYDICPKCGGGVELTNSEHGDLNQI